MVSLKAPPVDGKANTELIEVLADYFGVPKSRLRIVSGSRYRKKVVELRG